uniref:Tudor domain-containing protein n=1 Tax=Gasterosteus aculeatus aculeatus TaxID=481459 RepID=A0AAQ4NTZ5_GASAC|nr:tudor domain-containing 6 [Gasterosteus aculeatus aculeatus]XP_040056136.1 tudor domain-containing 6 [Gasterosteus aculeatus aculeatus]
MCSIPGLPKLGSEVPVVITRVNPNPSYGLVELWVHIDDGRKHVYEQMKEEIQIPKRRFYGSEGKPGDLCLVCISSTWHRARIVSSQGETCNVFLIDQAQPHIATSEALAWGHSDCFLLPPETESCLLANVVSLENKWPEIATTFLVSLPGKKFNGVIQHVLMPDRTILLDIPAVSKHVCEIGVTKKMPMDEFKSLVQKCLEAERPTQKRKVNNNQLEKHGEYFYPELLTDAFEIVNVTQVTSPCKMFCKLHIFSKAVKILSEQIQQHYEESSELGEMEPLTCGDPCAARGVDGRWRRSLLKETLNSDGAVEVLYVDEGKLEVLPIGDMRPLNGKFLRMPVVTYPCSLEGVKDNGKGWTTDQIDYLNSLLLNKNFVAKFNHHNIRQNVYNVILYGDNDTCMNNCFKDLFSSSKTEQDTNFQNGLLNLPGKQGSIDLPNKVPENVDGEETLPCTKKQAVNGMTDDLPTSRADELHVKESSEQRGPVVQINGHLSKSFPSEVQNPRDDDMLTVGSSVNVNVSFVQSPHAFWCQPKKNGEHLRQLMQDLQNHYESIPPPPLVESICVARNPDDDMWYRARIHASHHSPVVDVRFIDYGQTETIPLRDLFPIDPAFLQLDPQAFQCSLFNGENSTDPNSISPTKECVSVHEQDVPLASFKVPPEVPEEVNKWFADSAIGQEFSISVLAKGRKGKFVVELFAGALNLNVKVKEMISKMTQQETFSLLQQTDKQLSNGTERDSVPNEDCLMQEFTNMSLLTIKDNMNEVQNDNGSYVRDELSEQVMTNASVQECEHDDTLEEGRKPTLYLMDKEMETGNGDSEVTQLSCPEGNENICMYKWRKTPQNHNEEVYASCIVGPQYFWCQYANTEDLNEVSRLAQEAGQIQPDVMFPETLGPGSPCLAQFSSDQQWYRAQVIRTIGQAFTVLFIDYGNESDVNLNNVRPLPHTLMDKAPLAFLCSLKGFDESKGSWNDDVYDDFYNLLVDKQLNLTVFNMKEHPEAAVPQYEVEIECERAIVNAAMKKYWRPVAKGRLSMEHSQGKTFVQDTQTESNMMHPNVCKETVNTYRFKKPNFSKNKKVEVYASCIVQPHYFWCQYTNAEELNEVSRLAQEAGWTQWDVMFPETLGPGSPCLAQFSSDKQWYRAQVIRTIGQAFTVLFIDYGNESDVDSKNVRALPHTLMEKAPLAFLCSLKGFDESKGSWNDDVYDDFYNLLVDKQLNLTVFNMKEHPEPDVPQYEVELVCEGSVVNKLMVKHWKRLDTDQTLAE